MPKTIGNPLSWAMGALGSAAGYASIAVAPAGADSAVMPTVLRLTFDDLRRSLRRGAEDMAAFRSDVLFVCLLYPVMGGLLLALAAQGNFVHLLFPVVTGFALIGPVAAIGLYEMSRKREAGQPTNWLALLDVMKSPRFGRILMLSLFNVVIFLVWIMLADMIFRLTVGDVAASYGAFLTEVLTTPAGWALAVIGTGVGFVLALIVLAVGVVSFPLLLDRDVSLPVAVATSVRVSRENPVVIATWGLIVAGALALGALPALLGLVLALPLLGHATWHLYRAAVV
jgi:uncharacterized membrane protein